MTEQLETHERDIPSIASERNNGMPIDCFTQLSYGLATSLAAAKRMTWEQTPWVNPKMTQLECEQIADYVSIQTGKTVPWIAIHNALLLGETYIHESHDMSLGTHPQILVVFPRSKSDCSRNERFLQTWHDQIVGPAFDQAWKDSGLVEVQGADKDFQSNINIPGEGTFHAKAALPAAGIINKLNNGNDSRVRTHWPEWKDFWGSGNEGKHTVTRSRIFDDAWKSIAGMIDGHPDLREFQDPFLIVVNRARTDVTTSMTTEDIYRSVGRQWDRTIDARFVVPGSFKVVVQTVLGDVNNAEEAVIQEEQRDAVEMVGPQFKRMADVEPGPGRQCKKRAR